MLRSTYLYTQEHCWIDHHGEKIRLGLTSHILSLLDKIEIIEFPAQQVHENDILFIIETKKASMEFHLPFAANIIGLNAKLKDSYELIHDDPYKDGWIIDMLPLDSWHDIQPNLLTQEEYFNFIEEEKNQD